jgi:nucleoid-associated protein YgaU
LAQHNRNKVAQADKLSVGEVIQTPGIAQLEQMYPDLCPKPKHREAVRSRATTVSTRPNLGGRTYVVQEGDTLFDIARNELGKATRWAEIYELNRDALGKDFDYLTPGMQLTLPNKDAREPADRLTRRPGTPYSR